MWPLQEQSLEVQQDLLVPLQLVLPQLVPLLLLVQLVPQQVQPAYADLVHQTQQVEQLQQVDFDPKFLLVPL
jgi:hypothetical protein